MPFDPDAYLSENDAPKPKVEFDPDAYLADRNTFPALDHVEQVQHPEISFKERAIVKNFANSPGVGVEYLKKQHPNLEIKTIKGEIVARTPGEQTWKVLDPDTGFFSKDFLGDVSDIGFDVARSVGSGLATTAGGLAGNIPGAMAAGGAAEVGQEALKQKLGQALGLPQELDAQKIGEAGVLGLVTPPIAKGTGAAIKGTYNAVTKGVGARLGEIASGVPKKVLNDYKDNFQRVQHYVENPDEFETLIKDTADKVASSFKQKRQAIGEQIQPLLSEAEAAGKLVDISEVKKPFKSAINVLKQRLNTGGTSAEHEALEGLEKTYDSYFVQKVRDAAEPTGFKVIGETPDLVTPTKAFDLKKQLHDLAPATLQYGQVSKKAPNEKDIYRYGSEALDKVTEKINAVSDKISPVNKSYGTAARQQKDAEKLLYTDNSVDTQKALNTFRNIDSNAKKIFQGRLNTSLSDADQIALKDALQQIQTQSYMASPSSLPLSNLGSTSTSRSIPLAGLGAGLGGFLGFKLGGGAGSAAMGSVLGGAAGGALGSPKTIGAGLRGLSMAEKAAALGSGSIPEKAKAATIFGAGRPAWEALMEKRKGKK